MMQKPISFDPRWDQSTVPRIGLAPLTRQAFEGKDLYPLWTELMGRVTDDAPGAGLGMDLSVIAQLRGDKQTGLAIQREALGLHQIFRGEESKGGIRLLALAVASDIGANMPVEFLLQGSTINLATLYLGPDIPLPAQIPAHDIAVIVASGSADCAPGFQMIEDLMQDWPVPVLNRPCAIRDLERDRLYKALNSVPGLHIPPTFRLLREALNDPSLQGVDFPMIIRPFGSHAGFGLARLEDREELEAYLSERDENDFFVSPYIDYSSTDGFFRKYRIAMIEGRPYPVHMAIAEEWKVWYLNADMALSASNRGEEADFMQFFAERFGTRHEAALSEMAQRIGLDYVLIDCAETKTGELLIFEADHCALVHDMDPVSVYPYKPAHMHRLFEAFCAMLTRRATESRSCAA
jgi:glutathione synthase/RimK-type ligase-like ATP-grasp enzyme